jgi:hypothetical protein
LNVMKPQAKDWWARGLDWGLREQYRFALAT